MTKKLICLLLAAFLCVSLIALLAACHNAEQTPEPTESQTETLESSTNANATLPEDTSADASESVADDAAYAESTDTADVFSLELPSDEVQE